MGEPPEPRAKRKEIYTYHAPWLIYGMNWSVRADQRFRLAIGSFEEEYNNSVRIVQLDEESGQFVDCGGFEHPYPTTKIMWMPDQAGNRRDLLATTGDYLRLWNVMDNKCVRLEALLNNVRAALRRPRPAPGARRPPRPALLPAARPSRPLRPPGRRA
jgi:WD repeat-containing protein 68